MQWFGGHPLTVAPQCRLFPSKGNAKLCKQLLPLNRLTLLPRKIQLNFLVYQPTLPAQASKKTTPAHCLLFSMNCPFYIKKILERG